MITYVTLESAVDWNRLESSWSGTFHGHRQIVVGVISSWRLLHSYICDLSTWGLEWLRPCEHTSPRFWGGSKGSFHSILRVARLLTWWVKVTREPTRSSLACSDSILKSSSITSAKLLSWWWSQKSTWVQGNRDFPAWKGYGKAQERKMGQEIILQSFLDNTIWQLLEEKIPVILRSHFQFIREKIQVLALYQLPFGTMTNCHKLSGLKWLKSMILELCSSEVTL
jgi:hypothetical protein